MIFQTSRSVGYVSIPWRVMIFYYMDVSKNKGTPKWMVKIMEKPY